jgi:hypothetical protein
MPGLQNRPEAKPIVVLTILLIAIAGALHLLPTERPPSPFTATTLIEDFDGETLESLLSGGWSLWYKPSMQELTGLSIGYPEETIRINENGELEAERGAGGLFYTKNTWRNFRVDLSIKWEGGGPWGGIAFRCDNTWISGFEGDPASGEWWNSGYLLQIGFKNSIRLWKFENRVPTLVASSEQPLAARRWYQLKLEVKNATIKAYLDNYHILSWVDPEPIIDAGHIGIINCSGYVFFDNLEIVEI